MTYEKKFLTNISPQKVDNLNCYDNNIIADISRFFQRDYQISLLGEFDFTYRNIDEINNLLDYNYIFTGDILYVPYMLSKFVGISLEHIETREKDNLIMVIERISSYIDNELPVGVGMDSYYLPWNPQYNILHRRHYFLIIGLVILFDTGIRVSELSALRKADVKGDCVHIHATEVNYKDPVINKNVITVQNATKTDAGVRDVYLSELGVKVMTAIMAMSGDSEWVFSENGKRIKSHAFRKKLYNICDLIHIKRRSPHKIRKAYATKLIYAGISENIVKELMGHTDIATTRKSYCIDSTTPEEFRNAVRQISLKNGLGTKLFPIGTIKETLKPCV